MRRCSHLFCVVTKRFHMIHMLLDRTLDCHYTNYQATTHDSRLSCGEGAAQKVW